MHNISPWEKSSLKITSGILKKLAKVNNHSMAENSPNLFTLPMAGERTRDVLFMLLFSHHLQQSC
jgi:hypothetical protein